MAGTPQPPAPVCPRGRPYLARPCSVGHFQGALLGLALMMSFKDRSVPVLEGGLRLLLLGLPTVKPARRHPMVTWSLVEVWH